jgi:CHAD domain-containing protein
MKASAHTHAEDHAPDVLRYLGRTLCEQWRQCRKRLKRCRQEFTAPAVHESRVETRRLLATLELLGAFLPAHDLKKPRQALKKYLDSFGRLRDTQVQLGLLERMRRTFPAAIHFRTWLQHREARLMREARKTVKQAKTRRLGQSIATIRKEMGRLRKKTTPAAGLTLVRGTLRRVFEKVDRRRRRVNAAAPDTIHQTRIAFKRFRYMVEALSPVCPLVREHQGISLHSYQTIMGEIQDMDVLLRALVKFTGQEEGDRATQRLLAEFAQQRGRLIRRFCNAADKLRLFRPLKSPLPRHPVRRDHQP